MARERILVVEDNDANLRLVTFLLSSKGYDVRGASDAQQALLLLETFRPRLILMDLQLPGTDVRCRGRGDIDLIERRRAQHIRNRRDL